MLAILKLMGQFFQWRYQKQDFCSPQKFIAVKTLAQRNEEKMPVELQMK